MLLQGKWLSLKNVDPEYKMGPLEALRQKGLYPELYLSPSVQPVREAEAVDHSRTPGGL